jgi:RNA polymerase sigma-70 factor (ECF subfamily)
MFSGSPSTHETLLSRLSAADDAAAWREFCDRYGLLIRRFAGQRRLQPTVIDDVMQEVFLLLTKSMPGFRYDPARGRFRSYLKKVVLHAIYRVSRQKPGATALSIVGAQDVWSEDDSEGQWETEWRQYHLRRALATIEPRFNALDRAAFDAYVLAGRDAGETAESLGMSIDQVYQAKSRILRALTQVIENQVREEG